MASIAKAVGSGATHSTRDDILLVQQLVNRHRPPPLQQIAENGVASDELYAAIREFQGRVVKMGSPDGRVDPGGKTLKALSAGGPAAAGPIDFDTVGQQQAIGSMVQFAKSQAHAKSKGTCSRYVGNAVNAGLPKDGKHLNVVHGYLVVLPDFDTREGPGQGPASGGRMGPKLLEVGFRSEKKVESATFDASFDLQTGDVVVLQTIYKASGAEADGHVAIWTGSMWISDFKQPHGSNPNVYQSSTTKKVVRYEVFRYHGQ